MKKRIILCMLLGFFSIINFTMEERESPHDSTSKQVADQSNSQATEQLFTACTTGSLEKARQAIAQGANLSARDKNNKTPLHWAVITNRATFIELVITGDTINAADSSGNTPLHVAASNDFSKIMKLLFERGAKVNMTNNDGATPLHLAVLFGAKETLEQLLLVRAKITPKDDETPIEMARRENKTEIVKYFEALASLFHAAKNNQLGTIREIISKQKVSLNIQDELLGNTALHYAAAKGSLDTVELMVNAGGADIDLRNDNGDTALHIAVDNNCIDIIGFLAIKTNLRISNKKGKTPLELAQEKKLEAVVTLLRALIDANNPQRATPPQTGTLAQAGTFYNLAKWYFSP